MKSLTPRPLGILAGCALTATILSVGASPAKAILYVTLIPINANTTRIKASGTINPILLPDNANSTAGTNSTAPSGADTSGINRNSDVLKFMYSASSATVSGRRFPISGIPNPLTGSGAFLAWSGTTPANNPSLFLRLNNAGNPDLWLPNSFTAPSGTRVNANLPIDGFFDVNLSLAQIGLVNGYQVYTSGSEQIILAEVPAPMPILGAAAAFGFSRQLRRRIRGSASRTEGTGFELST